MNDNYKERLKAEIELFKIYAIFLIGLITGISTILLKREFDNTIAMLLLLIGGLFLFGVVIVFIQSYFTIKKLIKFLKQ